MDVKIKQNMKINYVNQLTFSK